MLYSIITLKSYRKAFLIVFIVKKTFDLTNLTNRNFIT